MGDFLFLSDSDEELSVAVEELISQAKDLCVLEQVSKIHCSGFTDSDLPSDLESRFRRLKSFPVSKPRGPMDFESRTKSLKTRERGDNSNNNYSVSGEGEEEEEKSGSKGGNFMDNKQNPDAKLVLEKELRDGSENSPQREEMPNGPKQGSPLSSPSDSPWLDQAASFSSSNQKKSKPKLVTKSGSEASPFGSEDLFTESPSPPQKSGCFWCSPKKVSKEKSKGRWSVDKWNMDDDLLLSDLGTFSVKEQKKILRKSMKEEEKIAREAEKLVKLAKQASSKMSFHGAENELSDDDEGKK